MHAVHAALAELHACLLGMARVLEEETFDHEDSGGETESEGSGKPAADVDAAHAWLHGAADIIGEYSSAAEQLLNRDPPACVFMPWRPLASDATALLGALEEVLRREASQQKRAMQSALGAEDSPGRTVVRFRRSAMPYRTYWAGKPAL